MLVLGTTGADFFAQAGVAVEAAEREPYDLWAPSQCPLCAAGMPIEDVNAESAAEVCIKSDFDE